jgi:DNA-binding MarR family transcriptional regulator
MAGSFPLDAYVADVLLRDLVAHDRKPSAFLLYLHLWRETHGRERATVATSLAQLADATGFSKSAVQVALKHLEARKLIATDRAHRTAMPVFRVLTPWRRRGT